MTTTTGSLIPFHLMMIKLPYLKIIAGINPQLHPSGLRLACRPLLVLLLAFISQQAIAQTSMTVKGRVKDSTGSVLTDASVRLYRTNKSNPVANQLSDSAGFFAFELKDTGSYQVRISMAGYNAYQSPTFLLAGQERNHDLEVVMNPSSQLKAVIVTARKPMVEKKPDRTIVNVEAMVSSTGTDALQLLSQLPGVTVDDDGNITLYGKAGVTVMINGKPTYLSGDALANYLRTLPSSALEQIELMSNPPAGFDAAGSGGVIQIKTKKTGMKGFNGNLSTAFNQGILFSTTNSLNLNYKVNRVNYYGNFSYVTQNRLTDLDINRNYYALAGLNEYSFDQNSYIRRKNQASTAKIGIDFFPDDKTTWGFSGTALRRPSTQHTTNTSNIRRPDGTIDSSTAAKNREEDLWKNQSLSFYFKRDLKKKGSTLGADVDYLNYTSTVDQAFSNTTTILGVPDPRFDTLVGYLPSRIAIIAAKTDAVFPLKHFTLETGLKASYAETKNAASFYFINNGSQSPDYEKTNDFRYKEHINAAYLAISGNLGRLSYNAGLRAEQTLSKGNQLGNPVKPDSSFSREYTNLFPTLFLTYKMDTTGDHTIGLTYGRRIERPFYQDLNPYVTPLDKFTLYVGNPFLRPSFSHELTFSYTYKQLLTGTITYTKTSDTFLEAIRLIGNNYLSRPDNLGSSEFIGFSINSNTKPAKWWTLNIFADVQQRHFEGQLYNTYMDTSAVYFGTNFTNQFQLGKDWSAELGGTYRTSVLVGQVSLDEFWVINTGIQKKILDKKGTIKLAVRDIFYSAIRYGQINFLRQADAGFRNRSDSRVFTLSFTYRFGKSSQQSRGNRSRSSEEEENRVRA
ncbi:TonB-dependent receptor [Flavihumibacter rivuli]|uniref:TonB-dependent receptor n=1 Tax=Flavihumibacter rivuli TaxID=2838156 RepID=UPI001BDEB03E|nr:TonB-dependent receptor [Flavihumibacter rivuli]ULQ56953.1 TonB-dependent receptor [Flavihumibacter rivuli]